MTLAVGDQPIEQKLKGAIPDVVQRGLFIKMVTGARKLFERIVRRRRDMRRPIPYRTRGAVARPTSGHYCRPTSLQWRHELNEQLSSLLCQRFQPQLATALAAERDQARWTRDVTIDEHAVRCPRPVQLLRFLKSSNCACVKISASVWGHSWWRLHLKLRWKCSVSFLSSLCRSGQNWP